MIYTDATPARAELRELAADGFPLVWLAEQIGADADTLGRIRNATHARATSYTISRIHGLHARLAGTTAGDHGIPGGTSQHARLAAARNGWTARKATS